MTKCFSCQYWKCNDPQNLDTGFCGKENGICEQAYYELK